MGFKPVICPELYRCDLAMRHSRGKGGDTIFAGFVPASRRDY
jgi:hypothetical protein